MLHFYNQTDVLRLDLECISMPFLPLYIRMLLNFIPK